MNLKQHFELYYSLHGDKHPKGQLMSVARLSRISASNWLNAQWQRRNHERKELLIQMHKETTGLLKDLREQVTPVVKERKLLDKSMYAAYKKNGLDGALHWIEQHKAGIDALGLEDYIQDRYKDLTNYHWQNE